MYLVEGSIAGFGGGAGALLNGGGQLDAAQTIEMEIFGEAELVAYAGRGFAGDLCDEQKKPVCRSAKGSGAGGIWRAGLRGRGLDSG